MNTRSKGGGGHSAPPLACLGEATNLHPSDGMGRLNRRAASSASSGPRQMATSAPWDTCQDDLLPPSHPTNQQPTPSQSTNNNNPSINATPTRIRATTCGAPNCKLCRQIVKSDTVKSVNTDRTYNCIFPVNETINCKSTNLVYLIQCKNCHFQYVGQTVQSLNLRINQHRSSKLGQGCKLLTEHLKSFPCKVNNPKDDISFSVQILQVFPGEGRLTGSCEEDQSQTRLRVQAEEDWMKKLRTVYPYGLNDKCNSRLWTEVEEGVYTGRSLFSKLPRSDFVFEGEVRCRKSQRTAKPLGIVLDHLEHHCECPQNLNNDNPCVDCTLNFARKIIPSLTKATAKKLGSLIIEKKYNADTTIQPQFYEAFLDMINSKFAPLKKVVKKSKSKPDVLLKVLFTDKHVQDLNISRILRDSDLIHALPSDFMYKKPPTLVYKHIAPIRNKIFNYSKEILNFNVDEFLQREELNQNTCDCHDSVFKDLNHGHIITGNLNIIQNESLKWLLQQGPNFREQKAKTNFNLIWKNLKSSINQCIDNWAQKEKVPVETFSEWKAKLLYKLGLSLDKVRRNPRKINSEVLSNRRNLEDLEALHSKFIMVHVDKASNNIALVCKNYYFRILINELGLNPNLNPSQIYKCMQKDEVFFSTIQKRFLNSVAPSLPCSSNNLPFIYAIPKLHKSPVKFRFLVSQKTCPLKTLNQSISKILKLVLIQHRAWCKCLYNFTGINFMWIADNFNHALEKIEKINSRTNGVSTKQFDFSTLYTSIPKKVLTESLEWCIKKAFIGGKKRFISVYNYDAKFVNNPSENSLYFNEVQINNILKFVFENAYFKFGNKIIKQLEGIMMGWDPGPFAANLSLYFFEHKHQAKLLKENYSAAKQNNNNSRFIDDINTLNNRVFEEQIQSIYPPEIVCNRENLTDTKGHFLEIDISITSTGKFQTKIFDKRDEFNFDIVKYPSINSNIPDRTVYSVFVSQTLRFLRVCSEFNDVNNCFKVLVNNFVKKGCKSNLLANYTKRTLHTHIQTFQKYENVCTIEDFIKMHF
jgi:hypothetical protein